jgi:hypothetical protein
MKQTLTYQPHSFGTHACRLRVEGFPDVSTGQGAGAVGIITGWSLDWVGHPQLEGRRDHLQALLATVLPYARLLLSGVARPVGEEEDPVSVAPDPKGGHRMQLRSGQPDTPPLNLHLDDAELADLVRVLDQCRLDPRLQLPLPVPEARPLLAREVRHRLPLRRRLAAPLGGLAALAVAAGVTSLIPSPRPAETARQASGSRFLNPSAPSPPARPASAAGGDTKVPQSDDAVSKEAVLSRARRWLLARPVTSGPALSAQVWQLAVNTRGDVVAATPVESNTGQDRSRLGLPATAVPPNPTPDTLLVRGALQPSGLWELAPWHGW